jgi:hypothetical protein
MPNCESIELEVDEEARANRIEAFGEFLRKIRRHFVGSHRGIDIGSILSEAHFQAERTVKSTPTAEIPAHLDQLEFLRCKSVETQSQRLMLFLVRQRAEKLQQIIDQRDLLLQRMSEREGS